MAAAGLSDAPLALLGRRLNLWPSVQHRADQLDQLWLCPDLFDGGAP
jgi:hypothetical protein